MPIKIMYGNKPPMLFIEGSSKFASAPSCGIKILTKNGLMYAISTQAAA